MTDDVKRWQADIDREIAEAADAKLDHGERKVLIERLAKTIAEKGYSNQTPYDVRIQQLREQRQSLVDERDEIEENIDDIETELELLREKREKYESESDRLEGRIEGVEADLRRGTNIFVGNPIVDDIADEYDVSSEEVVDRLKERNPDVPPWAFSNPMEERFIDDWTGFAEESKASLPVDERSRHRDRK